MKVHLYGITRMRDGRREWLCGDNAWSINGAMAHCNEPLVLAEVTRGDCTIVEFTADIQDPMTEADEITETMRRG